MSKTIQNNTEHANLCAEVCKEFQQMGFVKDIDPRTLKESYNIQKHADGQCFKIFKPSLHEAASTTLINLDKMPQLKIMIDLIDKLDSEIKKEGGRIFITETLVYKIKKGAHSPLIVAENLSKKSFERYRKLCDEIIDNGFERDRYRTEETYMLTKAANGEWSISSSHENFSGTKKILHLEKMPQLKAVALKLNKLDSKFQLNGGRIFITPNRIYRLNNKVEVDFKI